MSNKTTIEIDKSIWAELNAQKREPGESFNQVVKRLLDE